MALAVNINTDWAPVRMPDGPRRQNLVILRTGKNSCHKQWPKNLAESERNWDILLSHYDEKNPQDCPDADIIVQQAAFKFSACYRLFQDIGWLRRYEYVWFCDDDIMTDWASIQNMFDMAEKFQLDLGQPTISTDSYWYHPITVTHPETLLRFTNYTEIMMPFFSAHGLRVCLPSFKNIVSGWGLDWVWPVMLGSPKNKVAMLDAVSVRHTRPLAEGTIYEDANKIAVDPGAEMENILSAANIGSNILLYGSIRAAPKLFNRGDPDIRFVLPSREPLEAVIDRVKKIPAPETWEKHKTGWQQPDIWQSGPPVSYSIPPLLAQDKVCEASFELTLLEQVATRDVPVFQIGEQRHRARIIVDASPVDDRHFCLSFKLFNEHHPAFVCETPKLGLGQSLRILLQIMPYDGWFRAVIDGYKPLDFEMIPTAWRSTRQLWLGSRRLPAIIRHARISPFVTGLS